MNGDDNEEYLNKMAAVNLARRNIAIDAGAHEIDAGLDASDGATGQHEEALKALVASVDHSEGSLVLLLYRLGVRHINAGRYDDARECLNSVLDMDPHHKKARDALATAMFNAGVTALNEGLPAQASELFETVVEFELGHEGALRGLLSAQHNLGVEALHQGDCEGARYHFSEVLRSDPTHDAARQASCAVDVRQSSELMRARNFKAALPLLERAESLFGVDGAQFESRVACAYNRAVCCLELGRVEDARHAIGVALRLDPTHGPSKKAQPVIERRLSALSKKKVKSASVSSLLLPRANTTGHKRQPPKLEDSPESVVVADGEEHEEEVVAHVEIDAPRLSVAAVVEPVVVAVVAPTPPPPQQHSLLRSSSANMLGGLRYPKSDDHSHSSAALLTRNESSDRIGTPRAISDGAFVGGALAEALLRRSKEPVGSTTADARSERIRRRYSLPPSDRSSSSSSYTQAGFTMLFSNKNTEFVFHEFGPRLFRKIREVLNITEPSYVSSMTSVPLTGGGKGEGKSGSYFFFSHDRRFIAKTVNSGELRFLLRIFSEYHDFMRDNPSTMLCRFVGLYSIRYANDPTSKAKNLVVMRNVMQQGVEYSEVYDLKGSLFNRITTKEEQEKNGTSVLKDQNFQENGRKLELAEKDLFVKTLRKDVQFLSENNVMDYSLVVGIVDSPDPEHDICDTRWRRKEGQGAYDLGIIDILQAFNMRKKIENAYKTMVIKKTGGDPTTISCVSPDHYAKRFLDFIEGFCE